MESIEDTEDLTLCKACKKEFKMFSSLLRHIAKKESCKNTYGQEYNELKAKNVQIKKLKLKAYYEKNKTKLLAKQRKYDESSTKRIRNVMYNRKNREKKRESYSALDGVPVLYSIR